MKKMNPKITIIVPVYNMENYIARCIKSTLEQSLKDIELILVDDGSTDGSGAICDRFASEDERIHVIHKTNAGQGIARNDALEIAAGKYVFFLDADDYNEPDTCEEIYALMEKEQADMCSFGYRIDSPDGEAVTVPLVRDGKYIDGEIKEKFVLHFFGDDPDDLELRGASVGMSAFRLSLIKENDIVFPSERKVYTEDTAFCLEFCKVAKTVVTTSRVYHHYQQNTESFSQKYTPDKMDKTMDTLQVLKKYADEYGLIDNENSDIRRGISTRLSMYVWVNLMAALKQEARRLSKENKNSPQRYVVKEAIKSMCNDAHTLDMIKPLTKTALPIKQKVLLYMVIGNHVNMVLMMCNIRAKQRV